MLVSRTKLAERVNIVLLIVKFVEDKLIAYQYNSIISLAVNNWKRRARGRVDSKFHKGAFFKCIRHFLISQD